jgi:hypothetical protein
MFNKKPKEPAEVELIHVTFEEYCNALRFIKTALKLKQIPFPYRSENAELVLIEIYNEAPSHPLYYQHSPGFTLSESTFKTKEVLDLKRKLQLEKKVETLKNEITQKAQELEQASKELGTGNKV